VAIAQNTEIAKRQKHFNISKSNLALEGYDAVSYFKNKPQKEEAKFAVSNNGITYYFASKENLEAFKSNPEKYEPAYGGWCAYAMAKGEKVEVDIKNYKITNGKLYLFYKGFFSNTLDDWNKEENVLLPKANNHWKNIFK
jgi:YHS domain-containing protein